MKAEPQSREKVHQPAAQGEVQRKTGEIGNQDLMNATPAQRQVAALAQMAQGSARGAQLRQFAEMAKGAPQVRQLQVMQKMAAQRAPKRNETGLPDNLKSGIEALSGISMDNVRVHYNSSKPAQLNALAYAQGTDIHVGPGQEKHLPHEAWHVVQQKQGRVRATGKIKGIPYNNENRLEREAEIMAAKGRHALTEAASGKFKPVLSLGANVQTPVQRIVALKNASEFGFQNGVDIEPGSKTMRHVIDKLRKEFEWRRVSIEDFEGLIAAPIVYVFRDFKHLNNYIVDEEDEDPPMVDNDDGVAMMVDDLAKDFGMSFKGAHIPYSGSRVYAVGRRGGVGDPDVWAMQNSATGHINSKQQSVVKNWAGDKMEKCLSIEWYSQVILKRLWRTWVLSGLMFWRLTLMPKQIYSFNWLSLLVLII